MSRVASVLWRVVDSRGEWGEGLPKNKNKTLLRKFTTGGRHSLSDKVFGYGNFPVYMVIDFPVLAR